VLKSYTYTPAGLLATATFRDKDGNTRTLLNTWDADSNRVGMNANGTQYSFVCDTTAGIPAVLEESTSGSTAYYIREPGGSLLARLHPTDGIRYYHFDELGSTRLLTDADGDITDKYAYDAYGSLLSHDRYSGSVNQPYQYVGQLGYYTHYQEPDFGLLQLGVRFYDAEVGRFGQRDPLDEGPNRYEYARGTPSRLVDPTGRYSQSEDEFWRQYWRGAWKRACFAGVYAVMEAAIFFKLVQDTCAALKPDEERLLPLPWLAGGPWVFVGYGEGCCLVVKRGRGERPPRYRGKRWPFYEGRCETSVVKCRVWRVPPDWPRT
jgi:RHS repeat-associated protein